MTRASGLRRAALALVLAAGVCGAGTATLFDFVTFDGIDYIRWSDEPGRGLARADLGAEFATVACSIGEDVRGGCSYGMDAAAAYLPAGTPLYAVRGYATEFRLAAAWRGRLLLYQAWRNPRARVGGDLFDVAGRVREIDVRRHHGPRPPGGAGAPARITSPGDVEGLMVMILRGSVGRPTPPSADAPQYWLTLWMADGTTLGRPYFADSGEMMGGVRLPSEFRAALDRHLPD
ncbi:MAG TPA: hypothetical protein VLK35_11090 [Methylomirabilota bacterium]|nr:hypothetical protein [Methylomirabilota bacterium]